MATAPKSKSAPAAAAPNAAAGANGAGADKNSGPIKVVSPDADGNFNVKLPHGAVSKVQIVDVDMVLNLADGSKIVLEGGALGAMDTATKVTFSDSTDSAAHMLESVGKISLQSQPQVLNSAPTADDSTHASNSDLAGQAQAANATLSAISQALTQLATVVQANAPKVDPKPDFQTAASTLTPPLVRQVPESLPERPAPTPQTFVIGPKAPSLTLSLVNLTGITQVGDVLYGSGGVPKSATDSSNSTQFLPQEITAGAGVRTIYADGTMAANTFVKVLDVQLGGDGKVQYINISGVPDGVSILNAISMGNGNYSVAITDADLKDYRLQLSYATSAANPAQTIRQTFTVTVVAGVVTADGLQTVGFVQQMVIKDASSANDLVYVDPVTGVNAFVLPAQGQPHIIHANDLGDTIYGSNANDFLYGGAGADTIYGGSGNTYFEGGAGADKLVGGTGSNTAGYTASPGGITIDFNTGLGTGGDAQGDQLTNISTVVGSAFDDTFVIGPKAANVSGGSGGSDTLSFSASTAAVTVDLSTGKGSGGYASNVTFSHIQNVIGSAFNDTFISGVEANAFTGGGGVDTVSYAASNAGVVVNLSAGTGSGGYAAGDSYSGIQNVIGSQYSDMFIGNSLANFFDGGAAGGTDTVSYAGSGAGVTVNFVNGRGTGGDAEGDSYKNIQNVVGSAFDDTFIVNSDTLNMDGGAGGMDTVSYVRATSAMTINAITGTGTGAYANTTFANITSFVGGSYSDTFIGSAAANRFDGGGGASNTVDYSNSPTAVTVDLYSGAASGGYAAGDTLVDIQNVTGGIGDDVFFSSAEGNIFNGGGGANTVNYSHSTTAVIVDLTSTVGNGTSGGYATGDILVNIQNLVGSSYDDIFVASLAANSFDGYSGTVHNRVSYANDTAGVIVDLNYIDGTGTSGGYAAGDKFVNIQDLTGGSGNDIFVASAAANFLEGGGGSNTVSYNGSTAAVTVDLVLGTGAGGYAAGDTLSNIQNVIGSTFNDTFIASGAANAFTGNGGVDTVSYNKASDGVGVTVDLNGGTGTGGFAGGDTYTGIQNVIGTINNDLFIASNLANAFDGGLGVNTVSYAPDTAGVIVNLVLGTGTGGFAAGDTYTNIQNATGGSGNDTFVSNGVANVLDGGDATATSHNRVDYSSSTAAVTVDLIHQDGTGTNGGYATGDVLKNIQDVTGSAYNDTFVASLAANYFDGNGGTHNLVTYINDTSTGVTVDLFTAGAAGTGGMAAGDTFANVQDLIGGSGNDTFIASAAANVFDGAGGTHNRVSYVNDTSTGVTVDLLTAGAVGVGGLAAGDTYTNIQDVTGGAGNDLFIASNAANAFDGSTGTHNRVSYASDTAGVSIDLFTAGAAATGGLAAGDTFANIQDLTGGSGNDTFIASAAANFFDGGTSTATSHNRVSYVNDTAGVTIDLSTAGALGVGGLAAGDTFANIQDLTGGSGDDVFIASAAANFFDGGASTAASHNRVSYASDTAGVTVNLFTAGAVGVGGLAAGDTYTNIQDIIGGTGNDTFVASAAANAFDGGSGALHNRVSYTNDTAGVTIDLFTAGALGVGGLAAGDTFANIQDITGGTGNDIFIASLAANSFDGGAGSHNLVSYINDTSTGVTVDLYSGAVGTGGLAAGDVLTNIQDITGGSGNDTFIANNSANFFDGSGGAHNRVSYVNDTAGVSIDLFTAGALGVGGLAAGDKYTNIQDLTGGSGNDIFIANNAVNFFDGGTSTATSHNLVSYANDTAGVTIDLYTTGAAGVGGLAAGDTFANIQDITGGTGNDTFIASAAANFLDGGTGGLHNRVSYVNDTAGVTVNLFTAGTLGVGGLAAGDTYTNIQDVTGGTGNDTFVASAAINFFDGGTGALHNRVSYTNDTAGVTIDLFTAGAVGVGGIAAGDTYTNIQDITGGSGNDIFIASLAANFFDGGAGTHNLVNYINDTSTGITVDLFSGTAGTGGLAAGDVLTNIQDVTGGSGNDTFIANNSANFFDGSGGTHNRVSYVNDTAGVAIDLFTAGALGVGGLAAGDTYTNIQDLTGGTGNDTFVANNVINFFDGGTSTATSHNRVSYANDTSTGITVDLFTAGAVGVGGLAAGDTYTNIQDLIGGTGNDIFIASAAANFFDGGTSTAASHNRVSYANDTAGVTVNLFTAGTLGVGGLAVGDTYANIQDVTGGTGNDTFVASAAANFFDGGTGALHNRVSYTNDTAGVTIDLFTAGALGVGGIAAGDTYTNIQDITGGSGNDIFITSLAANFFDGGAGTHNLVNYINDTSTGITVDLFSGTAGTGGLAAGDVLTNIQDVTGGSGNDTFIANNSANFFDGSGGTHNRVSYVNDTAGVSIDLFTAGALGVGGLAAGDTYTNIQDLTGGTGNDTFVANNVINFFDGGTSTATSHNRVSYANDTSTGITIDLFTAGAVGVGGQAAGDTYTNIQDLTGGTGNDIFIASAAANFFDGGTGGLHNRVSYANDTAGVTVNLFTAGALGVNGLAAGDTYANIQDITGGTGNDTFIASLAANFFDGGTGALHNRVSYANDTAGVTVDLFTAGALGVGGLAAGDTFTNIQDLTGGTGDDTFVANGAINFFDGGTSTATSHNRVSYANDTAGVTVNLSTAGAVGVGGLAAGDTYTNIQDVTGGSGSDIFFASLAANRFDGGTAGTDTVNYSLSTAGVTVDLATNGAVGVGGFAVGDTWTHITNAIGTTFADNLTGAAGGGSTLTGGLGADHLTGAAGSLNNTANYAGSAIGVQVDLFTGLGATNGAAGSEADGDILSNIQNVIGTAKDDIFFASLAANAFTGNGVTAGGIGDTVSYSHATGGVTANLVTGLGSGDFAAGDTYVGISNLTGGAFADTLTGAAGGNSILIGGAGADTLTGAVGSTNNTVSYVGSTAGVNVDLYTGAGTVANTGGDAAGDILSNIQNITGSANNDTFYASLDANKFVGGGGNDTVSYLHSTSAVTVDLFNGSLTAGGFAAGDTFNGIQNITGSAFNDTFYGHAAQNAFDGGIGGTGDTVNYSYSTAGVTVDLMAGVGTGGFAANDTYSHIQNVVGTAFSDLFIANASANAFNGGTGTTLDTVSYQSSTTGGAITASLATGTGTTGDATGDTFTHIANLTGSAVVDSNLYGDANDNVLTALGTSNNNYLSGGAGNDTLDGRLGGHNTLIAGSGTTLFQVYSTGSTIANVTQINGAPATTSTLQVTHLSSTLDATTFSAQVSGLSVLDLRGTTTATSLLIGHADVIAMGRVSGSESVLTIKIDNTESLRLSASEFTVQSFPSASNIDYAFYSDNTYSHEIARIHLQVG